MSTIRALRPLTQQVARLAARPTTSSYVTRRALNMDTAPSQYAAHATVTGGRNGHAKGKNIEVDLRQPTSMGGSPTKNSTDPEELFALGYGACFQGAMAPAAKRLGLKLPSKSEDCIVEATVHLVGDLKTVDIGIRVDMKVKMKGVSKEDITKIVEETKTICPYSRATKGNFTTNVEVESM